MAITIRYDGTDITDSVIFNDAQFTMQVNGLPGTCAFRVRDDGHTLSFSAGKSLTLDIDGQRQWGGFVSLVASIYSMPVVPTVNAGAVVREFRLTGVDYNILFDRRVLFNKANPTRRIPNYPRGTDDDVAIVDIASKFLDLSGDGLSFANVVHVGTPNPDMAGNLGSTGDTWGLSMNVIARYTGAVYFIDADRVVNYLDSGTSNTSYYLTDQPGGDPFAVGYRELALTSDAAAMDNDALVWGAGQGRTTVNFKRVQSSASQILHNRWQVGEFDYNLYTDSALTNRASTMVYGSPQNKRGAKDDAMTWEVVVFRPVFRVGDVTTIMAKSFDRGFDQDPPFDTDKFWPQQTDIPVRRVTITFPTPDQAMYRLLVSHNIDLPWMGYEFWFPPIRFPHPHFPEIPPPDLPGTGTGGTGITDTFNRPDDVLGIADCGYPWDTSGTTVGPDPGPVPTVANGRFFYPGGNTITASGTDADLVGALPYSTTGLSTHGSIDVIANHIAAPNFWRFLWTPIMTSGPTRGLVQFTFDEVNGVLDLGANDGSNSTFTVNAPYSYPGGGPPYTVFFELTNVSMSVTINGNTQFLDTTVGHGIGQSGVDFSTMIGNDGFRITIGNISSVNGTLVLDNLDIFSLNQPSAAPTAGFTCETFTGGGAVFNTQYPYAPGITEVFINGILQRIIEDYEESDSVTGLITLTSAVASSDTVKICYIPVSYIVV